jgi:hypothetical protein
MTIFSLPIVPGLSPAPTLQRYAYTSGSTIVGAAVGSAVTGVVDVTYSHVWNFDVSAWAVGDYWVLLSGASTPNALPWPGRVNATGLHYEPTWEAINAIHAPSPVYPSAIAGLCHVLFAVVDADGSPAFKATVSAIVDGNSTYNGGIVSTEANTAQTDASGNAILTLLQNQTFTAGGIYTLKVTDRRGKLVWEKRCRIADTTTANAEDFTAL